MELVTQAAQIATLAHRGQTDKAGRPYIDHPRRVAERLVAAGEPEEVVAAGWLHDTLEDTWVTPEFLVSAGINASTIAMVEAVTKRGGESTPDYVARIVAGGAVAVKRADLADNTDPARVEQLDPATRARLAEKYSHFLDLLALAIERRPALD